MKRSSRWLTALSIFAIAAVVFSVRFVSELMSCKYSESPLHGDWEGGFTNRLLPASAALQWAPYIFITSARSAAWLSGRL